RNSALRLRNQVIVWTSADKRTLSSCTYRLPQCVQGPGWSATYAQCRQIHSESGARAGTGAGDGPAARRHRQRRNHSMGLSWLVKGGMQGLAHPPRVLPEGLADIGKRGEIPARVRVDPGPGLLLRRLRVAGPVPASPDAVRHQTDNRLDQDGPEQADFGALRMRGGHLAGFKAVAGKELVDGRAVQGRPPPPAGARRRPRRPPKPPR